MEITPVSIDLCMANQCQTYIDSGLLFDRFAKSEAIDNLRIMVILLHDLFNTLI